MMIERADALLQLRPLGKGPQTRLIARLPLGRQRGRAIGPARAALRRDLRIAEAYPATAVARQGVRLREAAHQHAALQHLGPVELEHAGAVLVGIAGAD